MTVADPEAVRWAALRLEVAAGETRAAAARTAGTFPRAWRGVAAYDCQSRIDETAGRARRVATAYEAAAEALLPYAAALADAQELSRRADALLVAAADAQRREAGLGLHASEGLRLAAERLHAEAAELERSAGAMCATALDAETGQAPDTSGWWSVQRLAEDAGHVVGGSVAGIGSLLDSAWHALPAVGSRRTRGTARGELWSQAQAAARVWEPPLEMWQALRDGRYGLAAGTLAMAMSPAKLGRHRLRDPRLAHREALREAWRRDLLADVVIHRQTAADMGVNGVSLVNEEARGGHAIERHVAATRGYLLSRIQSERRLRASTFADLPTAEYYVNEVLRRNAARLADVYEMKRLALTSEFQSVTGRLMVRGSRRTIPAHRVTVVLRLEGGEPVVYTAHPEL